MSASPPAVLRLRLADARRAGVGFDDAWAGALDAALDATGGARGERSAWREALSECADAWRAGFDRVPATSCERALLAIVGDGESTEPEVARCEHCGGSIPPERGAHGGRPTRFCRDWCRRRFHYERERARAAA